MDGSLTFQNPSYGSVDPYVQYIEALKNQASSSFPPFQGEIPSIQEQADEIREQNRAAKAFFYLSSDMTDVPVVDIIIQEFGDHFDEINTDLLQNMLVFNPCDSFSKFDASKLMILCEIYPYDFDNGDKIVLASQLGLYVDNVRKDERFANLKGIADLARVMVETRKHISFHLVYRLLKLTLLLHIATAMVERCFSATKIIKTNLGN
ncbi:uncharacterized protein LOC143548708 [Bidens hawaiensis]|uniref:uncharacterized protein LOC143548708 n=1 Tax=Bidens hawaiensis TaxID=980011 RepID=UPI00404AED15